MEQDLVKIFKKANYSGETVLSDNVWSFLVKREKRITKIKLTFFSTIGVFSLAGMVPIFKILIADFTQSGFYEYFSLLFSGGVLNSWKELAYSLAEALPTVSILLSLSIIFIFFLSIRYVLKQIIKGQLLAFN